MKAAIYVIAVIVLCIVLAAGVIALIGAQLPKNHIATRSLFLNQPPESVYAAARDFAAAPTWRSDVKRIDLMSQPHGQIHFREEGKNGTVNYELTEDVPARRMVTRILDTDLGYSGKWIYAFAAENGGTRVTITEEGEVSNVIFRFMSRYVFGQTASLDQYLTSLAKKFGESASPQ
jgi:uncharacterized protein YndB with AHSA1/START domain